MSQFGVILNELIALGVKDDGLLDALLDLCKVMIEKDYPLIHDRFGDTFPSLTSKIIKADCYQQEVLELVDKLEEIWGEWSEFEG